jgi:hypothetical protein
MSSKPASDRKRKPTKIPKTPSSCDDWNPKEESNKVRRVSTNASKSIAALLQVDTPVATEEVTTTVNTASTAANHEEFIDSIGKRIRYLAHTHNAEVNAALDALNLDLKEDKKKCDKMHAAGGCLAPVLLLEKCLDKAISGV